MPSASRAARHGLFAERDDVALAFAAGTAKVENVEAFKRQHLAAGGFEQLDQALVYYIAIGGGDGRLAWRRRRASHR